MSETTASLPSIATAAGDTAAEAARGKRAAAPGWRAGPMRAAGLLLPGLLLILWAFEARRGLVPTSLLPSPELVATTLLDMARSGDLARDLSATGSRLGLGMLAGVAAGLVLGGLVGAAPLARRLLDPLLQGLRSVPSIAWVPLFILWFGIFETSKVLLIAVGVFFPVYLNLAAGIAGCDRKLLEVGHVHGLGALARLLRIQIPASLPSLVVGLRGGLGLGWMFVAAAELMGASDGLGFELMDGEQTGRPERVLAALLMFALCGKATDLVLAAIGRTALAWQDTEAAR